MAKYVGSPWGEIHGKLGETVGAKWKSIKIVKAYKKPNLQKISLSALAVVSKGNLPKTQMLARAINQKMIFATLSYFTHINRKNLILPVWKKITPKNMTHFNFFIKHNLPILLYSIPQRKKLISPNNLPNLSKLQLSFGISEPTQWFRVDLIHHKLKLSWDPNIYSTGHPDDPAFAVIIYWKIPSLLKWTPKIKPWKNLKSWGDALNPIGKRKDGEANIQLPVKKHQAKNIHIYLFFFNKSLGYSLSLGTHINSKTSLL